MREHKEYVMYVIRAVVAGTLALALTGCLGMGATQQRARLVSDQIATQVCTIWTPVTDTTSPQVRGNNRAHYEFCPKKEKK